ncbi:MAG: RHS repeat-associated core domain-containing protein [Ruminococcaceae bacterium]|nr:RHS repeat-associated core domain-containing protein [Oscillospiraceae bacterium]
MLYNRRVTILSYCIDILIRCFYYLAGSTILSEEWTENNVQHILIYLYDAEGTPIGMQYKKSTYSENSFDTYFFEKNLQGDIVAVYDENGTKLVSYTYDAWGNVTITYHNSGASTAAQYNPFRYRGYYYDSELGFYYLNSRYYDPETSRFISADGQINNDILGNNLFVYCGNNPVMRLDSTGRAWWIPAGIIVGGILGGATKIASNLLSGKKWSDGVIAATVSGATYGGVMTATGDLMLASLASAAAESLINEVLSYTPLAEFNGQTQKDLTLRNALNSASNIIVDTAVGTVITAITGKVASKIIPTNKGWFTPIKFKSSFLGKYAIKSHTQSIIQSAFTFAIQTTQNLSNDESQQPIIEIFQ